MIERPRIIEVITGDDGSVQVRRSTISSIRLNSLSQSAPPQQNNSRRRVNPRPTVTQRTTTGGTTGNSSISTVLKTTPPSQQSQSAVSPGPGQGVVSPTGVVQHQNANNPLPGGSTPQHPNNSQQQTNQHSSSVHHHQHHDQQSDGHSVNDSLQNLSHSSRQVHIHQNHQVTSRVVAPITHNNNHNSRERASVSRLTEVNKI